MATTDLTAPAPTTSMAATGLTTTAAAIPSAPAPTTSMATTDLTKMSGSGDPTAATPSAPAPAYRCKHVGPELRVGNIEFVNSSRMFYECQMDDYVLLTNADFSRFLDLAPRAIKPLKINQWLYVLHVPNMTQPAVTRDLLSQRVINGQILAYRYARCSVGGNDCVYYGYLPTLRGDKPPEGTHTKCRVCMQAIWPRELYVYLREGFACPACPAEDKCMQWECLMSDGKTTCRYCAKRIPWPNLYIMMGNRVKYREDLRAARPCEVCAQCPNCYNLSTYCRRHKKCNHKTREVTEQELAAMCDAELGNSSIKTCKRVT